MEQATITTYGPLALRIRELAERFPGVSPNRVGRALLHFAIQTYDVERVNRILSALTAREDPDVDWVIEETAAPKGGNRVPPEEEA